MKALSLFCALSVWALGGCGLRTAQDDDPVIPEHVDTETQTGITSPAALPSSCRPSAAAEIEALYDATEASVHELVTCGGIQMQVALSMKVMIFASNEDLVSPSARSDIRGLVSNLGMVVDNPFTQADDGSWTMEAGGTGGSTFSLTFFDPETGQLVGQDPFSLDSYLLGVTARSSRTWEEMKQNPTAKTTFTYDWTDEGPLAHLLADGGPIPNPIVIEMSLVELGGAALGLSDVDYGAFESVPDILVESQIHMIDERGNASIAYDVTGNRASVRELVANGSLAFEVDGMVSTDGTFSFNGSTSGLAYLKRGTLAGEIHYDVSGAQQALRVISDFGAGLAYPEPRWECE